MVKIINYILILLFTFNVSFAMSWDFWNFSFYEFLFGSFNQKTEEIKSPVVLLDKVETGSFLETETDLTTARDYVATTSENYDYNELLKFQARQKDLLAKMNQLVVNTKLQTTVEDACDYQSLKEEENCKKDLFVGCANSLYLGYEMTHECKQFSTSDYLKYLESKKSDENVLLKTDIGEVYVSENPYTDLTNPENKQNINSSSINNDFEIKDIQEELATRKIIEPPEPAFQLFSIKWNTNMPSSFFGWVTGWGTLFAINGGKREAGQIMNKYTAFGYNPYNTSTCIVSLPYKTVDKFFGTSLDYCVKTKNVACILKIKNQIKDRAIEVVMIKNGRSAVFPLGDFGPAEWTGNAIDFTSCARKVLGATGKDLIKFRPLAPR